HFPQGGAAAIGYDGSSERRAPCAVFPIDVGDDLVAPLVLEVDIDIRRLVALPGDEAFEERVDYVGSDIGDVQAITDDRIGGRSAPLAKDALFAGKLHDVVNG